MSAILNLKIENSTDATRGQPLAARLMARKSELEDALADVYPHEVLLRQAIETALATVTMLMTRDLVHPAGGAARDLARWLERHKLLAHDITRASRRF